MRGTRDYSKGKIYELICLTTKERYIGSTCYEYLSQRLRKHKEDYKKWLKTGKNFLTSLPIIGRGNYQIVLLENFPCQDNNELGAREGYWIREKDCVNKNIPGRTLQDCREQNKERTKKWCEKNKEHMIEYYKKYYEQNKERITEHMKQYREQNKERITDYFKQYREKNKEQICEYQKQKIKCECGSEITRSHLSHHRKSKKHIEHFNNIYFIIFSHKK